MSAFNVCESWTSAFYARERCMSAFNACEYWASVFKGFKLARTRQIIEKGHTKTVIADEPCYVRPFE